MCDSTNEKCEQVTSEDVLCGWGLGGDLSNCGPEAVGWSSASDAGGVAASTAHPCISCSDRNFFILSMTGNWEGGHERTGGQWWSPL